MPDPLDSLDPDQLARMLVLCPTPGSASLWTDTDAAAAFRHQLAASLLPDLADYPGAEPSRLEHLIRSRAHTNSFFDQLTSPEPDPQLLEAIKNWARARREDPASPLRGTPATLLYYAAIAASVTRGYPSITKLTLAQLYTGFTWSLHQPAATSLASLFSRALETIAPS